MGSLGLGSAGSTERQKRLWGMSFGMIALWTLWLLLISTLKLPWAVSVSGTSVVILVGGYWWSLRFGAFCLLLMSWIYAGVSLTPSGFYWLAMASIFVVIKILSLRLSIRGAFELALAVTLAAFFLELVQIILLERMIPTVSLLSWRIWGVLFLSAFLHGAVALLFSKPLMILLEAR